MINFQIFWKSGPRITVSRGNNCQLFTKISRKCKITTVSPQYSVYHRRMRKFENNHQLVQGGTGKSGIYPVYILRVHISKTTYPNFTKFCVHATHGCCMVVQWRRCSMLRTSSLVDGVIFSHSGPYGTGDAKCSSNWFTGGQCAFHIAAYIQADLQGGNNGLGVVSDVCDCLVFVVWHHNVNVQWRS